MDINDIIQYAKVTGQELQIQGASTLVDIWNHKGQTFCHFIGSNRGWVGVKDMRTGNHYITFDMLDSGYLLNFRRSNFATGAKQTTFNRQHEFERHVRETINK